ncbi:MAG: DUF1559 domain-containing protein [Planctomycetia bacterium]|nr:DUF1559 domain-containing protein [Planctomycetia bacterium]
MKKAVESDVFEVPIIVYDDNYPVVHSLNFIFARDVCFGFRLRDLIDGADTAIDSRILIIRLCEAVHKSPKGDNNVYEAHALLNLTFQLDSTLMAEIPADDWLTLQDALKEFEDKILCDNPNRTFLQKLHKIHWLTKISTNQTDDYYNGYVLGGLDQFLRELGFDWNIVCQEMLRPEDKRTTWPAWNRTRPELYPPTSWLRENLSLISRTTRSHFLGKLIHARINELSTPITEQKICKIRMLRLTAALWGYQATHGHLPPLFTTNEKGERLHSWRVLILPWLGEQELYEKIRLDEPWDSEYNLQFHDQVQKVWFCPSTNLNDSGSVGLYQPIVGPNALFDLSGQGKSTQDFFASHPQCDLKRVALLVETSQKTPRCWMEPDDGVDMDLLVAAGNSPYCGSLKLFCEHENYNIITSDMTIMPGTIQNESLFRYACITGISTRQITKKENNHDTTIE